MNQKKYTIIILTLILIVIIIVSIFYELFSKVETFNPEFPDKYDQLVIDHNSVCWIIEDKDEIQNFIKDSKTISEHIGEGLDWYVLRFIFEGKQNYKIIYDDIGYPEKSTAIISKHIEESHKYYTYIENEQGAFTYDLDYYISYTIDNSRVFVFEDKLSEIQCKNNGLKPR